MLVSKKPEDLEWSVRSGENRVVVSRWAAWGSRYRLEALNLLDILTSPWLV